jgi:hypothetical protein
MKLFAAILAAGVFLTAYLEAGQFGTGFAVSPKGYLVTCHHVIRDARHIVVHTPGGGIPAKVVALDPANDLAILQVEEWNGRFLGLTSSTEVNYASLVTVAGFPDPTILGRNPKVSQGIVNAMSGVRDDPRFLQVSAPVQPGNSGGPLISASGRVVGVIASGLNSIDRMAQGGYLPQSVNYAIKTELVYHLLRKAAIKTPKFGTKTKYGEKQVQRALNSIVLVEGMDEMPRQQPRQTMMTGRPAVPAPTAARGPWVFPDSHARPLSIGEVRSLPPEGLWRARNEIYLRRGFFFTTAEGREFARQFGSHYQPRTPSVQEVQQQLTPVEVANLQLIAAMEANPAR